MCPFWCKSSTVENGDNWASHPGTVISNLVSFPRNNTSRKKLGGKQQIKCWKWREALGPIPFHYGREFALDRISHTKGAFLTKVRVEAQ